MTIDTVSPSISTYIKEPFNLLDVYILNINIDGYDKLELWLTTGHHSAFRTLAGSDDCKVRCSVFTDSQTGLNPSPYSSAVIANDWSSGVLFPQVFHLSACICVFVLVVQCVYVIVCGLYYTSVTILLYMHISCVLLLKCVHVYISVSVCLRLM